MFEWIQESSNWSVEFSFRRVDENVRGRHKRPFVGRIVDVKEDRLVPVFVKRDLQSLAGSVVREILVRSQQIGNNIEVVPMHCSDTLS